MSVAACRRHEERFDLPAMLAAYERLLLRITSRAPAREEVIPPELAPLYRDRAPRRPRAPVPANSGPGNAHGPRITARMSGAEPDPLRRVD
jgi:hypothetical protein